MDGDLKTTLLEQRIRELESLLETTRQEVERSNRGKMMFLAKMSHEIRTPMNSIIGIYNLLSQTDLTPEQSELLEIINISSHNLLAIINDILDLGKIESGQLRLENKPFLIQEQLQHVIKMLSIKAKGKGIALNSRIESAVPSCLMGDAVRLNQILINLTNNAIKFTVEGSVTISVESIPLNASSFAKHREYIPENLTDVSCVEKNNVLLLFRVTDTGVGLSPEDQVLLFQDYAQINSSGELRYEGSGLGLSISRQLTQLLNGRIGLKSEKNKGSVFWVTLQFQPADEQSMEVLKEVPARISHKSPLHILIVEDNLLNQKFAVTTLERAGHEVDIAENGRIALEKYKKNAYDLILMDIAMPVMDGLEATQEIRKIEMSRNDPAKPQRIKIVAITAHVMVTDRDKCLAAGMDEYLAKPYRPKDLLHIIDALDFD